MRLTRAVLRSAMRAGTGVLFHPGGDVRLLAPIFTDFGRGAACGMDGISSDGLTREHDQTAWQRRIFFREGYAFGNALAHAVTRQSGNPEGRNRATADYRIMQYTGYGFWNGFARSLRLPVVDEQPAAWGDVADYPALRPFLAGGRSFALMVRTRTITPALLQSFEREATPALAKAAWHGCGRALWFSRRQRPDGARATARDLSAGNRGHDARPRRCDDAHSDRRACCGRSKHHVDARVLSPAASDRGGCRACCHDPRERRRRGARAGAVHRGACGGSRPGDVGE